MCNKCKHASYDVQQKLDVIERIRNSETRIKVSRELGVPESTLRGWIKDKNKLRTFLDELNEGGLTLELPEPTKKLVIPSHFKLLLKSLHTSPPASFVF
ncbi:TIGD5 protein, partial [Polypterus senegalus]